MTSNWSRYAAPAPLLRDHGLLCLGAGEQADERTGFMDRVLDCHALVVISDGSGWYEDRARGRIPVTGPSIITVPPGRLHGYGPGEDGWTEHWLLLDGVTLRALVELEILDARLPVTALR